MIEKMKSYQLKDITTTMLQFAQDYKKTIGLCILFVSLLIVVSVITMPKHEGNCNQ